MIVGSDWRFAYSSTVGIAHSSNSVPCQDASLCRTVQTAYGESVLIAFVSDGAGSAEQSHTGARLACDHFSDHVASYLLEGQRVGQLSRAMVESWLHRFQMRVASIGADEQLPMRAYACTLLGAVIGERWNAFMQIGDGAIVVSPRGEPDEFSWVYWPQQGEYANVTYFATEPDAPAHLEFDLTQEPIEEVAIFSDGLQHLVLDYASKIAFDPFFVSAFQPLRAEPPGHREGLSQALARYLDSTSINARTGDDKSLILASRRVQIPERVDEDSRHGEDGTRHHI